MVTISKFFFSDNLNSKKYELLYEKAKTIRQFKNKISDEVNPNLIYFCEMSFYSWVNYFRIRLSNCNNQDISEAIKVVYTNYLNKLKQYEKFIKFKIQKQEIIHNDIIVYANKTCEYMNYICKYWSDNLIEYLKLNLNKHDKNYNFKYEVINFYEKYEYKILPLILSKRKRMFDTISDKKIIYYDLTFKSCSELRSPILNRNKNESSKYGAIIVLGGQKTKDRKIKIPVKYSQDYHGTIESYDKPAGKNKSKKIYYQIEFPKDKVIKIVLTKEVEELPAPTNKENYYGIDVNIKKNLFCDKYGNTIDFDRTMLSDYIKFLNKNKNKCSHFIKTKIIKWFDRFKYHIIFKCHLLVEQCIKFKYNHIVLEDLKLSHDIQSISTEFGVSYYKILKIINFDGLKNIIKRIANKHDIQVTFVQSHYTSQTCKCGHISKNNRKTQEIFKCESCGRELNADMNAASNIEDRLALDVLRSSLLSKDKDGNFKPKKLRNETIKFILYDFYSSQQKEEIANSMKHLNCA